MVREGFGHFGSCPVGVGESRGSSSRHSFRLVSGDGNGDEEVSMQDEFLGIYAG